ncbi:MAG: hypothetical protein WAM82_14075 [Thermoanaerobaculia bacterium]
MKTTQSFRFSKLLGLALLLATTLPALADGPFQFFPVAPCRVVDTRNAASTNGGPALTANVTRRFRMQGNCGVPVGAKAVSLNVTIVQPGSAGWMGVYPASGFSGTSTINFSAGEFALANGAIVPVSAVVASTDLDLAVFWSNYSGTAPTANVLLDITGYFQ